MILLAAGLLAFRGHAQTITDGGTLRQGGVTYRLWGIDAPSSSNRAPMAGPLVEWRRLGCRH